MINKNDVPWFDAPKPRWWHRCKPWTIGAGYSLIVQRCACGAIRQGARGPWIMRNGRGLKF